MVSRGEGPVTEGSVVQTLVLKYIVKLQINPPQFSLNNIKELLPLGTTESSMACPQNTPSLINYVHIAPE